MPCCEVRLTTLNLLSKTGEGRWSQFDLDFFAWVGTYVPAFVEVAFDCPTN